MQEVTHKVRAGLVHINFRRPQDNEEFDEFVLLAESAGIEPALTINSSRTSPDARYCIGSGKLQELAQQVAAQQLELLVFNHALSPAQERNIEKAVRCRVLDRVGLILDIFARRARSHEGQLQVELAQLQHLSTRLVRGWSHLERQKGGIGLRGPGETQLETDRRLLGKRIKTINSRLGGVKSQRLQSRRLRKSSHIPQLSLVGYTNAGKSSLFNALSGAGVYVANKLFATLDPTIRRVELAHHSSMLLSDTVGFIRHIPPDLIESFHATLEEVRDADLLLHIIDSGADCQLRIAEVNQVIADLGAEDIPQIIVYNKSDLLRDGTVPAIRRNGTTPAVWVSAKTGDGIEQLKQLIAERLRNDGFAHELKLPATAGKLRASLFRHAQVTSEQAVENGGWLMRIQAAPAVLARLCRENGLNMEQLL
ncbi:MAG: ribosome rescue GTPase HflX [Gammaproteobacteria bacterium]